MPDGIANHKIGDSFNGFLLIKSATKGVASNGQPFLTLLLADKTDTIDTKVWSATDYDVETYTNGEVILLSGTINEFRGKAQLQNKNIRLAEDDDNVKPEDFLEKAPESEDVLRDEIEDTIAEIDNTIIRQITRVFIERYSNDFFIYPAAATIHHAFVSGLAYHTVSMLRIAKSLCNQYPELNTDMIYAGIILHDIGKIHEFTSVTDTSKSLNGSLLGHIPIMASEIKEVANDLNLDKESEEVMILQHLVLAHHGKPEWGSARTPIIREAELLHYIDMIDAKLNTLDKALGKTEPGGFTEKLFALDNRAFYKPTI